MPEETAPEVNEASAGSVTEAERKQQSEKDNASDAPENLPEPLDHVEMLCQDIEKMKEDRDRDFEPYRFVQKLLNKNYHPRAIRDALERVISKWRFSEDSTKDGMDELEKSRRKYYMTKKYKPMKNIWNRYMRIRAKADPSADMSQKETEETALAPGPPLPKKLPDAVRRLLILCSDMDEKNDGKMDFDSYRFVQESLDNDNHPEAIVEVMIKMLGIWGGVEPWRRLREALELRIHKYSHFSKEDRKIKDVWRILMGKLGLSNDPLMGGSELPEEVPDIILDLIDVCYKVDGRNRGQMDFDPYRFVKESLTKKNHPKIIIKVLSHMADIWGSADPWERCRSALRHRRGKLRFTHTEKEVKVIWHALMKLPASFAVLREMERRKAKKVSPADEHYGNPGHMEYDDGEYDDGEYDDEEYDDEEYETETEFSGDKNMIPEPPSSFSIPKKLPEAVVTLIDGCREVRRVSKGRKKDFEPDNFVQEALNKGYFPEVVIGVIRDIARSWDIIEPWGMGFSALHNRQEARYDEPTEKDEAVKHIWNALMEQKAKKKGPLAAPDELEKSHRIPEPNTDGINLPDNPPEALMNLLGLCQKTDRLNTGDPQVADPYFFVQDALNEGYHPKIIIGVLLDASERWKNLSLSTITLTMSSRQRQHDSKNKNHPVSEEDTQIVSMWNDLLKDRPRTETAEEDTWPEYDLSGIPLPNNLSKPARTLIGLCLHVDELNQEYPKDFDPFDFIQNGLKEGNHPKAVIHVLMRLTGIWKFANDPWEMAAVALSHRRTMDNHMISEEDIRLSDMWEILMDTPEFIRAVYDRRVKKQDSPRKKKAEEKLPEVVLVLADTCRKLDRENNNRRVFDPWLFALDALNEGNHPRAVIHVIEKLTGIWKVAEDPRAKGNLSLERWRYSQEYGTLGDDDHEIRHIWNDLISKDRKKLDKIIVSLEKKEKLAEQDAEKRQAAAKNKPLPPLPDELPEMIIRLAAICALQYAVGKGGRGFDPYLFTQESLDEENHPLAIIHVIGRLAESWKIAKYPRTMGKAALIRRQEEETYFFTEEEEKIRNIWNILIERPEIFEKLTGTPLREKKAEASGTAEDNLPDVVFRLAAVCDRINSVNAGEKEFDPHIFVQRTLDKKNHPEAIVHTLDKLTGIWDMANDPWSMGETSLLRCEYSGEYRLTPGDEEIREIWNDLRRKPEIFDVLASASASRVQERKEKTGSSGNPRSSDDFPPLPEEVPEMLTCLSDLCRRVDELNRGNMRKSFDPWLFVQDTLNSACPPGALTDILKKFISNWQDVEDPWQTGITALGLTLSGEEFGDEDEETKKMWNDLMSRRKVSDALIRKIGAKPEMEKDE